jgi:hypothetical protein
LPDYTTKGFVKSQARVDVSRLKLHEARHTHSSPLRVRASRCASSPSGSGKGRVRDVGRVRRRDPGGRRQGRRRVLLGLLGCVKNEMPKIVSTALANGLSTAPEVALWTASPQVTVAPPASQNANLAPSVEGQVIRLAARHAKLRRDGYAK